jgi:hypothetical protein
MCSFIIFTIILFLIFCAGAFGISADYSRMEEAEEAKHDHA